MPLSTDIVLSIVGLFNTNADSSTLLEGSSMVKSSARAKLESSPVLLPLLLGLESPGILGP